MSRPRVLIADDSRVVRTVLKKQMAGEDIELFEAEDGLGVLELCRTDPPDVVLLDVSMPGMTGYEVLQAMQADPALAGIPVVFLSGRVDADDVATGLRLGAHDYLRKPVETGELIARVSAAIRTKRLQDQLRSDNAQLREMAPVDQLTGLLDVAGLQRSLQQMAASCRRDGEALAGILIDVIGLAAINDRHGWSTGDEVLARVASAITARVPGGAVVGRCGPDEFLVLLSGAGRAEAVGIGQTVAAAIDAAPLAVAGESLRVMVAVGAASALDADPQRLVRSLQDSVVADRAARVGAASDQPGPSDTSAAPASPETPDREREPSGADQAADLDFLPAPPADEVRGGHDRADTYLGSSGIGPAADPGGPRGWDAPVPEARRPDSSPFDRADSGGRVADSPIRGGDVSAGGVTWGGSPVDLGSDSGNSTGSVDSYDDDGGSAQATVDLSAFSRFAHEFDYGDPEPEPEPEREPETVAEAVPEPVRSAVEWVPATPEEPEPEPEPSAPAAPPTRIDPREAAAELHRWNLSNS